MRGTCHAMVKPDTGEMRSTVVLQGTPAMAIMEGRSSSAVTSACTMTPDFVAMHQKIVMMQFMRSNRRLTNMKRWLPVCVYNTSMQLHAAAGGGWQQPTCSKYAGTELVDMSSVTLTVLLALLWLTAEMRAHRDPMPLNRRGSSCWMVDSSSVCFGPVKGTTSSPNSCTQCI
jgi:hypothetical protein